ncbi:hypothetical protein J6590_087143 [Homalodisca vitripennis]|nr:hypothetical protein J6590_087143 [Homalodisca vitripennis]
MIRFPFTSPRGLDYNNTNLDMKVLDGLVAVQTWDHVLGLQKWEASWLWKCRDRLVPCWWMIQCIGYGGTSFACARSRTARWRSVSGECEVDRLPVLKASQ